MDDKIDFVITWVDGADEVWQKIKSKYSGKGAYDDLSLYRDWDTLRYWFRGVEKFAPFVNRIHFVTCGHLPAWLNTRHEKLNIVRHSDYMPAEYLPTFNSHAIELNLHRIEGLEEQFVYFNDDTFIMDYMQPTDFFVNGLPCASAVLSTLVPRAFQDPFFHYYINNLSIINSEFDKKEVLLKNLSKWFNYKYGKYVLKNIYLAPVGGFCGFFNFHLPNSFLLSTFKEMWEKQYEALHATSLHKFRTIHDVNQYLPACWQLASGNFYPRKTSIGRFFIIGENDREMLQSMALGKYKLMCINDSPALTDFDQAQKAVIAQFEQLLPIKSGFEL